MTFRLIASFLAVGLLGAGLACATGEAPAGTPGPTGVSLPATYNPAQSFAPLVEALQPAVVHVLVKQEVDMPTLGMPDQMWEHFFGPFGWPGVPQPDGDDPDQDEDGQDPHGRSPFDPHQGLPDSYTREGQGSGFLISADGYLLTNNHVIEDATEVTVKLTDDTELDAKVVGVDPRTDVALLKVDARKDLPWVRLGRSDALKVGDWVVAIGNPFGLSHTVTAGIVSAKGRVIGAGPYDDFIQTDASINPGNSGGPLFDLAGNVVGINTAISARGQGIGFAVPIDMVTGILEELKSTGRVARGWIGVALQPIDADLASGLGLQEPSGALVREVYPDTPGAKAGLVAGDVIVSLDGQPVKDQDALVREVGNRRPGTTATLGILRAGKARDLKLTLEERPDEDALARGVYTAPPAEKGKGKAETSKDLSLDQLGIQVKQSTQDGKTGPVVTSVDADSPAADKLRKGDLVLEVNRKPVKTLADVEKAMAGSTEVVLFLVERKGVQQFVAIRPRN